ncbi:hypothetical protein Droror1_Dr00008035 [Drosera rotundifolia]
MTIENLVKPNLSGFNPQSVDDVQQSEANVQKSEDHAYETEDYCWHSTESMLEKGHRLFHILYGFNPQSVDDVQQSEANVQKSEDHAYETEDYETQSGDEYETEDYETQSGDELQGYESFDSDEVLERMLVQILRADCTRKFVSFFKQYPYFLDRRGMELIFREKAKKCVLLLLKGGLGWRPSMTKCSDEGETCLSLAASYFCDPDVVEAILSKDRKNYMVNLPYYRTLPVQAALEHLRNSKLLAEQINADSFTKLIIFLLYLPELRPIMKVVQMLASRTRGINDIAFNYAEDGEVEKLAALLLVAREKVMAPFIESGMSIGDLIIHIIDWGSEANYLRGNPKYVLNLMKAHQLLEVFKKAGRPLEAFGASEGEKVPQEASIILVAKACMEVGHKLEYKDIDFGDACRLDERGMEIICHELGIPSREGEKKPASKLMSPRHSKNLQGLNPFQMIPTEMVLGRTYRQFHGVVSLEPILGEGTSHQPSRRIVDEVIKGNKMGNGARHANAAPFFGGLGFMITSLKRAARSL